MKLLIIEDEPGSAQRLKKLVEEIDPDVVSSGYPRQHYNFR